MDVCTPSFVYFTSGFASTIHDRKNMFELLPRDRCGVEGSGMRGFCAKYAMKDTVHLDNKTFAHGGCSTLPRYVIAGSRERKFCGKHNTQGMANVLKKCAHGGFSMVATYGLAGKIERIRSMPNMRWRTWLT